MSRSNIHNFRYETLFSISQSPFYIFSIFSAIVYCVVLLRMEWNENLHPWVRVDQAGRPLSPKTLSILVGLTLKLVSLCVHY